MVVTPQYVTAGDERNWAGAVHLAALFTAMLTSWVTGFGGMLAAFAIWFAQSDKQSFVARHAAEAFNFNFSLFVYLVAGIVLSVVTLGLGVLIVLPAALALACLWLFCSIRAALAAFRGDEYRYPLSWRILR